MREVYSPERKTESKITRQQISFRATATISTHRNHGINSLVMLQEQGLCHTAAYTAMPDPAGMYILYTHFNNKAGRKKLRKTYLFSMLILINFLTFLIT